jgi:hypothetical protein
MAELGRGRGQDRDGDWQEVTKRWTADPKIGGGGAASGMGRKAMPAATLRKPLGMATSMKIMAERRPGTDEDRYVEPC